MIDLSPYPEGGVTVDEVWSALPEPLKTPDNARAILRLEHNQAELARMLETIALTQYDYQQATNQALSALDRRLQQLEQRGVTPGNSSGSGALIHAGGDVHISLTYTQDHSSRSYASADSAGRVPQWFWIVWLLLAIACLTKMADESVNGVKIQHIPVQQEVSR